MLLVVCGYAAPDGRFRGLLLPQLAAMLLLALQEQFGDLKGKAHHR